jgi:hypothetical protein
MTYTVTAINSENRVVCETGRRDNPKSLGMVVGNVQGQLDERSARRVARTWRKDPSLRDVKVISRDEYGRGKIEAF